VLTGLPELGVLFAQAHVSSECQAAAQLIEELKDLTSNSAMGLESPASLIAPGGTDHRKACTRRPVVPHDIQCSPWAIVNSPNMQSPMSRADIPALAFEQVRHLNPAAFNLCWSN
jgi:hypothetical protein